MAFRRRIYLSAAPLVLATLICWAPPAEAQNLVVNGKTVTLGGIRKYNKVQVINGGRILVPKYNGKDKTKTGNLQIVANHIYVDSKSIISADGAGYQPRLCDDGRGPTSSAGGRGGCSVKDSGGGGAHLGKGGRGTKDCFVYGSASTCQFPYEWEENCGYRSGNSCVYSPGYCYNWDALPSVAGVAYEHSIYKIEFGAAGGDKGCLDGYDSSCSVGGGGGGRLVLAAINSSKSGTLKIEGRVSADGWRGCGKGNDSAGGGAGGSLLVVGDHVTIGAKARVSAAGGLGGDTQGHKDCPSCAQKGGTCDDCGGGGGGGIISLLSGTPASLAHPAAFNVSGAKGGTCGICKGEAGGATGELQLSGVYLGEICDGFDNDFDGQVDEGLGSQSCGSGSCKVTVQTCNTSNPSNVYPNDCLPKSLPVCQAALADTRSRFLVIMDTSGSMLTDLNGVPTFGDGSSGHPGLDTNGDGLTHDSRLYKAKAALTKVISAYAEIDFGLARFAQGVDSKLNCQVAHWIECAGICCTYDNPKNNTGGTPPGGVCKLKAGSAGTLTVQVNSPGEECIHYTGHCGAPRRGADILVGFEKPINQTLMWLDHTENSFKKSAVEGDHCDYKGGGDCELRGTGPTPLAGALQSARAYLARTLASDKISTCRKYAVILLTDGAETCSGDPNKAAAELLKLGVETYVIGFSVLSSEKAKLNAIANAGSTSGKRGAIFVGNETQLATTLAQIVASSVVFEKCNNADDDCDLLVDEDFSLKGKACDNGLLGVCKKSGTYVCKKDGTGVTCNAPTATAGTEICNGKDDDCDGQIDEIPGCPPCLPEICDGKDNDCDGKVDDSPLFVGLPCGASVGQCKAGKWVCDAATKSLSCAGGTGPSKEICDGKDNNCDTIVDNFSVPCYPAATGCSTVSGLCEGTCKIGSKLCQKGAFGPCKGYQGPAAEVCNGLDDDCDGLLDELVSSTCVNYSTCKTYSSCKTCPSTPVEICDGKDNDCNGKTDDNALYVGQACGAPIGECTKGKWVCDVLGTLVCKGGSGPKAETCDGKDNDCNGVVDDKVTGMTKTCGTDVGQCVSGKPACVGGKEQCLGGVAKKLEVCDCKDNDCNGKIDDNVPCPTGSSCVNCQCLAKCKSGEFPCAGGFVCKGGYCHATKCANVKCPDTEKCLEGKCVSKCKDVTCKSGEKCDVNNGRCVDGTCYSTGCPKGQICLGVKCVPHPCPPGKCPAQQMCVDGKCFKTCLGVKCPPGQDCFRGHCKPTDPCKTKVCQSYEKCKVVGGAASCVGDPCGAITCMTVEVCVDGKCLPDPCRTTRCPPKFSCQVNRMGESYCLPLPDADFGETKSMMATGGGGFCAMGDGGGAGGLVVLVMVMLVWRRRRTGR